MEIGVLSLQGAVSEHIIMLNRLGVKTREVRLPKELYGLDGLIIPGGESTTMMRLMLDYNLAEPIKELANQGFPIFGTCAGMILLAKKVTDTIVTPLGVLNIEVKRNAFGRQRDSFETDLFIPVLGQDKFRGIFIRAPLITKVNAGVDILCQLNGDRPVAVRQGKLLACAFHPELTDDLRFHEYFLSLVRGKTV